MRTEERGDAILEVYKIVVDAIFRVAEVRDSRENIFIPLGYLVLSSSLVVQDPHLRAILALLSTVILSYSFLTFMRFNLMVLALLELANNIESELTRSPGISRDMLLSKTYQIMKETHPVLSRFRFRIVTPVFYLLSIAISVCFLVLNLT